MRYQTFLTLYLSLFFGLFGVATLALLLYLSLIFEHNSYESIAKRQVKNDSIYGSALNENFFSYRLKMIELQKPDVLAIGSSRVGQFKAKYFNLPFYTAVKAANDLFEMQKFIDKVLEIYAPKIVILGLDPWWFNKKISSPPRSYQILRGNQITAEKIKGALMLILENKLPISHKFFSISSIQSPYTSRDSLGIRAITTSNGSFRDGSYFYASTLYQPEQFKDQKFSNTFWRIQNNNAQFVYRQEISQARIKIFNQILSTLHKKNIKVIAIITPVAHTIAKAMLEDYKDRYGYLFELFEKIKELKIANFFDPSVLPNSTDCEFYDGFHGGDITYARILLELSKKQPDFKRYLNLGMIHHMIKNKSGYAYSGEHFRDFEESDFLQIGCKK